MKSIRPAIAASILTIFAFAPASLASTTHISRAVVAAAPNGISLNPPMVLAQMSVDERASTLARETRNDTDAGALNLDSKGDNGSIDRETANKSEQAQNDDSDKTDPDQTAEDDEKDGDGPDSDDSDPSANTTVNGSSEESIDTVAR